MASIVCTTKLVPAGIVAAREAAIQAQLAIAIRMNVFLVMFRFSPVCPLHVNANHRIVSLALEPRCTAQADQDFLRSTLRSGKISLQKCAILCNADQTPFVRLIYDSQCCATQRKSAQFVRLELEIRCSIWLNYGRTIGPIPRFPVNESCRLAGGISKRPSFGIHGHFLCFSIKSAN
jgi:hypothetical protein